MTLEPPRPLLSVAETKHTLSFDIEEIWQGEFARKTVMKKVYRANETIPPLLDLLDEFKTRATFFIVADCISNESLKLIAANGHEIGFHTKDHVPLWEKEFGDFFRESNAFKKRVKEVTGQDCIGFRAPSFSMDESTKQWAIHALWALKFKYDSSVVPSLN